MRIFKRLLYTLAILVTIVLVVLLAIMPKIFNAEKTAKEYYLRKYNGVLDTSKKYTYTSKGINKSYIDIYDENKGYVGKIEILEKNKEEIISDNIYYNLHKGDFKQYLTTLVSETNYVFSKVYKANIFVNEYVSIISEEQVLKNTSEGSNLSIEVITKETKGNLSSDNMHNLADKLSRFNVDIEVTIVDYEGNKLGYFNCEKGKLIQSNLNESM